MTANVLADRADVAHLSRVLNEVDPDVLLTQELGHVAAETIAAHFPHHDLRPNEDARGRGIASRLDAEFGEIPLPWRPGLWARVLGDESPSFLVANIHMRNPVVFPWWQSARIRGRQLDSLFAWADDSVQPDMPFILGGDMNASPAWPVYKVLAERWDDLVARSAEESGVSTEPTWAWRPGWPRLLRIDHVFGTGARAEAARVEPLPGSDHAAVIVDLLFD
ncbi:MAG TPA: endonuclease/exonuclease/phosphatase family protein [Acidimicrobiia bacterium]|nr:endonuclease/exonuclease/phosphatase family protein [Acidimicrobiia bacterium]